MAEIAILDVGHGNCALLIDSGAVTFIDAPTGASHIEELRARGITAVDTVLISHADADHCGGVLTLLLDNAIRIRRVLVNTDSAKKSGVWDDLQYAFRDAELRYGTRLEIGVTTTTEGVGLAHEELAFEILGPHPTLVAKGPGSKHKGRNVTSNSASVVVRILHRGTPVVLFCGDMDRVALDDLLESPKAALAPVLVYPHHGGMPGGADAATFARELCALVQPHTVVFSIGRSSKETPRADVVTAVRATVRDVRIVCTQLSHQCALIPPLLPPTHLGRCTAKGRVDGFTCAGSLELQCDDAGVHIVPDAGGHGAFVEACAPTALCRRPL